MPTEPRMRNGTVPGAPERPDEEATLREVARAHVERVRRLKVDVVAFVLGIGVLTVIWVITQYQDSGGWPDRLSDNGAPGDWDPWIVWAALVWGGLVAIDALKTWARQPTTEAEIDREVARITRR